MTRLLKEFCANCFLLGALCLLFVLALPPKMTAGLLSTYLTPEALPDFAALVPELSTLLTSLITG